MTESSNKAELPIKLVDTIAENSGKIRFDAYMEAALYDSQWGYYTTKRNVFGSDGDFTTASEMSPIYARLIGKLFDTLAPHLDDANQGHAPTLVEIGAGTGRFANEFVKNVQTLPQRYVICEVSETLKAKQSSSMQSGSHDAAIDVSWISLDELDESLAIVIANEVFDAFPVRRFRKRSNEIEEQFIGVNSGVLHSIWEPVDEAELFRKRVGPGYEALPDGYEFEINFRIDEFFEKISSAIKRGLFLVIDYGEPRSDYYFPDREEGTLVCHSQHRINHDPLRLPGAQDITAAVDFTAVVERAVDHGWQLVNFVTQGHALAALADESFWASLPIEERISSAQAFKTMLLPGQMGERMKFMLLSKGIEASALPIPKAIDDFDMSHRL